MGIDYTFFLRIGFELDQDDIEQPYLTVHKGKFHFEDRFDPKTGKKIKPEKVIDEYGGKYFSLEYDDQEYESLWDVVNDTDFFHKKFNCEVSIPFESELINFYLEIPKSESIDCGKVNMVDTSISISWIEKNKIKLLELKNKLEKEFNIDIGEPKIFIESWIG